MRKTIALALIISVTGSILAFDQFYIMTSGGPQNRMISVVYYIFNQSFVSFNLGYGAALSIVLLAILVAISIVQLWLLRVQEDRLTTVTQAEAAPAKTFRARIAYHATGIAICLFFLRPSSSRCWRRSARRGSAPAAAAALADKRHQHGFLPATLDTLRRRHLAAHNQFADRLADDRGADGRSSACSPATAFRATGFRSRTCCSC
jgi:ABC-type Fe3+ transport system permease subunit